MEVKVVPDGYNDPLWIRVSLTREQLESIGSGGRPLLFAGTADIQYVSKHDVGNRNNVEIRIRDLSLSVDGE